jgi:SAM-dependent methyltransferase
LILCPACRAVLRAEPDRLRCTACGRSVALADGIFSFAGGNVDSSGYDPAWFDRLEQIESRHFWFRARRRLIARLFERHVERPGRVLEVGTGTGSVARMLADRGYRVAASDIHREALDHARAKGLTDLYQFDLARSPFCEQFDAVGLFDVLEHVDDDHAALEAVWRALRPGGRLVLTVPAHAWLWSGSDAIAGHRRRYGPAELRGRVRAAGFDVLHCRCFFVALVPWLLLRRLLGSAGQTAGLNVIPVANGLMSAMLEVEDHLLGPLRPGIGGSIALVAQRPAGH